MKFLSPRQPDRKPDSRRGNDYCTAWFLTDSSIGVWQRGIEIDRVSRFENVLFRSDMQFQLAAEDRQELHPGVMVQASLSRLERLELSEVGVQLALHCGEVQRFEVERNITPIRPLWKTLALGPAHDPDDVPLLVAREEVLQSNAKHQGDA